jgi:hypothetical protein
VSVEPDTRLRDEAVYVETEGGMRFPVSDGTTVDEGDTVLGRPTYRVVNEFREWYKGYESAHIEYSTPEGETVRTRLENSYQPEYGKRYYAKLKDLERGIEKQFQALTTGMLTFTASHVNEKGNQRCPADHMREVAEGWRNARKMVHKVLSGRNWEYARIWEPHQDGYGHLHVAIFVEGEVEPGEFEPVMSSYVENVEAAGSEAHAVTGDDAAVSVNDSVENLGSYISEYLGVFGESILDRPLSEQMFHAVTWATNTRRLDFSNGAQEIMKMEQFRRETGLNPEDRGGREAFEEWCGRETGVSGGEGGSSGASGGSSGESDGWGVDSICYVHGGGRREHADPTSGGVETTVIDGRPGSDPPRSVE